MKIGILYICTGKYTVFWKSFYESCEKHLLNSGDLEKEYFIFTDASEIAYENNERVHRIEQDALDWPYITLFRFKIFNASKHLYDNMDYLYFFNANMLCVQNIDTSFLPNDSQELSFLQHPGFYNKTIVEFTYERNMCSSAGVEPNEGKYYFQGALNGGRTDAYLKMCEILEKNIDKDLANNIIAVWHDESHLNRYAIDHQEEIKVLDPSYGYPEGWELPFEPKIIIRDKNNFGGHDFLRNKKSFFMKWWSRFFYDYC